MGKIIGSILLIISFSTLLQADILLRMTDQRGSPISQAGAGQAFIIEATISDSSSHFGGQPSIAGLEKFNIRSSGMRINSVNGRTQVKYVYEVSINEPGVYDIGPARLGTIDKISNTLKVVVGESQMSNQNETFSRKKTEDQKAFLKLFLDKKKVSVGERVQCCLRFYYNDPTISIKNLIAQESPAFRSKNARSAVQGTEIIDGQEYHFVEWVWDIYPTNCGKITIPAYGANYEKYVERDDFWGGLGRFFGNRIETKRIYSNAATLKVDPIPETDKPVNGIGEFAYIHLSAQPTVARQGEGILVTVEIAGDGDMDAIEFQSLQNLPESLKAYESKQTIIPPSQEGDVYKKRIEFILQGMKTGSFEIPPQTFYYYDVKKKQYVMLESAPLTLNIMPSVAKKVVSKDSHKEDPQQQAALADIHTSLSFPYRASTGLPKWFLMFLTFLPVLYLVIINSLHVLKKKKRKISSYDKKKVAFPYARKRLNQMFTERKAEKIYSIFIELFADRCNVPLSVVSPSFIDDVLTQKGISSDMRKKWHSYFEEISERAFGAQRDNEHDNLLFRQAEQWMQELEKYL